MLQKGRKRIADSEFCERQRMLLQPEETSYFSGCDMPDKRRYKTRCFECPNDSVAALDRE